MSTYRGKPRRIPTAEELRSLVVRPGVTHWITKEGMPMRPEDMELSHKLNTLNFCVRKVSEYYEQQSLAAAASAAVCSIDETHSAQLEEEADWYLGKSKDPEACWSTATRRWPVLYKIRQLVNKEADDKEPWKPEYAFVKTKH